MNGQPIRVTRLAGSPSEVGGTHGAAHGAEIAEYARGRIALSGVGTSMSVDELLALAEGSQIPITTTVLGKSVISETHPLFVGLYEGAMGNDQVTKFVEESDCLLLLGTFMTDINLGIYTANLDPGKCIYATSEQLRIRHHHFHNVLLPDFIRELAARRPQPPKRSRARR